MSVSDRSPSDASRPSLRRRFVDACDAIAERPVDTFRSQLGRSLGRALPNVIAFLPDSAFTRLLSSACATVRPSTVPPPPPPPRDAA